MNNNVDGLVQVFGISSASATEILQSCAEPAVWKYQLFNFLILQCLSWYSSVATLHPIINYCFWHNRQGAHKPYRVSCSLCSYITWLCLHDKTCDIASVTSNLWSWLHNAVLFPHQCFDCFAFMCYVCFYHCVFCTIGSNKDYLNLNLTFIWIWIWKRLEQNFINVQKTPSLQAHTKF